jgi:hypothetical protein
LGLAEVSSAGDTEAACDLGATLLVLNSALDCGQVLPNAFVTPGGLALFREYGLWEHYSYRREGFLNLRGN